MTVDAHTLGTLKNDLDINIKIYEQGKIKENGWIELT